LWVINNVYLKVRKFSGRMRGHTCTVISLHCKCERELKSYMYISRREGLKGPVA
jgi:hypothetical protein